MKKSLVAHISFFLLISFIGYLTLSCQKKAINGSLDGEWEVIQVTPVPPEWGKDTRIFYNFSRDVCQLTEYGLPFTVGNMVYNGETMTLYFPFIDSSDKELQLKQYGIYRNPITLDVIFEGKSRLTLTNDEVRIDLKKF